MGIVMQQTFDQGLQVYQCHGNETCFCSQCAYGTQSHVSQGRGDGGVCQSSKSLLSHKQSL